MFAWETQWFFVFVHSYKLNKHSEPKVIETLDLSFENDSARVETSAGYKFLFVCKTLDHWKFMALFETLASALDATSGFVLSSHWFWASTRSCQNNHGAKLAWAESGAKVVVSKRAYNNRSEALLWDSLVPVMDNTQFE